MCIIYMYSIGVHRCWWNHQLSSYLSLSPSLTKIICNTHVYTNNPPPPHYLRWAPVSLVGPSLPPVTSWLGYSLAPRQTPPSGFQQTTSWGGTGWQPGLWPGPESQAGHHHQWNKSEGKWNVFPASIKQIQSSNIITIRFLVKINVQLAITWFPTEDII